MPSAGLEPPLGLLLGRPGGKEMEMAPGQHVAGMHPPFLLDTERPALHWANTANAMGRGSRLAWPAEENVPFLALPLPGPSGQTVSGTSGRTPWTRGWLANLVKVYPKCASEPPQEAWSSWFGSNASQSLQV